MQTKATTANQILLTDVNMTAAPYSIASAPAAEDDDEEENAFGCCGGIDNSVGFIHCDVHCVGGHHVTFVAANDKDDGHDYGGDE
ncbi:Hypothetical predicted protein [Octopus vulgaris]|uniref:Uncharacterized protein n=1 Tax=Octopus vulgaris TaxID=6645 RepID=A0AA36APA0_OCTVU|nr:Hypothetical predicted protein [Octopus vulgaris]